MRLLPVFCVTALPFALFGAPAFAAGSDDTAPPTPTETTAKCKDGQVWDEKTKACIAPTDARLDDDTRFRAVRELAWAGRPEEALTVLQAMAEGDTDRVLTYKGFAHRKAGRLEEGLAHYARALARNPDNVLARSYLGQAYVEMDEIVLARAELDQIRARGGQGTWAEIALDTAIRTGQTTSY